MLREQSPTMITIGTTVAASTEIDMSRFAGGSFQLPAGSGTTEITVYAQVGSVEYGIANDENWNALPPLPVVAGLPYPFPPSSYYYPRIKLVASAGAATANVPVAAKS